MPLLGGVSGAASTVFNLHQGRRHHSLKHKKERKKGGGNRIDKRGIVSTTSSTRKLCSVFRKILRS